MFSYVIFFYLFVSLLLGCTLPGCYSRFSDSRKGDEICVGSSGHVQKGERTVSRSVRKVESREMKRNSVSLRNIFSLRRWKEKVDKG